MKILYTLIIFFVSIALADDKKPVNIIKEQKGNSINYRIEGARAPTQDLECISISKIKNTYTPPDIYTGAEKCILKNDYNNAVQLILFAGLYSFFDVKRVTDETAKEADLIIHYEFVSKFADFKDFELKLQNEHKALIDNPKALKEFCAQAKKIGYPNYYPNYMILHGMRGFSEDPHKDAILKDFNPKATWDESLKYIGHCK